MSPSCVRWRSRQGGDVWGASRGDGRMSFILARFPVSVFLLSLPGPAWGADGFHPRRWRWESVRFGERMGSVCGVSISRHRNPSLQAAVVRSNKLCRGERDRELFENRGVRWMSSIHGLPAQQVLCLPFPVSLNMILSVAYNLGITRCYISSVYPLIFYQQR